VMYIFFHVELKAKKSKRSMEDEDEQDDAEAGQQRGDDDDDTPRTRRDGRPKFTRKGHQGHKWARPQEADVEDVIAVPSHAIDDEDRTVIHTGEQSVNDRLRTIKNRNVSWPEFAFCIILSLELMPSTFLNY
jgi:hypothetical protein